MLLRSPHKSWRPVVSLCIRVLLSPQLCTAPTPGRWSTPPASSPTPCCWWAPPSSTPAALGLFLKGAHFSPATVARQGLPFGHPACPTVSVSPAFKLRSLFQACFSRYLLPRRPPWGRDHIACVVTLHDSWHWQALMQRLSGKP